VRAFLTTLMLFCALALAATGCGGSSDDDRDSDTEEIRAKAVEFEAAIEADDNEAFCDIILPSYVEKLGGEEECLALYDPKKNLFFTADDTDMRVTNIDFKNDELATAFLANKGFVYYTYEDGEWYPTPVTE